MTSDRGAYGATSEPDRLSGSEAAALYGRLQAARRQPGELSGDGDRRQRSQQVLVRLSPTEAEDARRLAAQHGITVPALLRAGLTFLNAQEGAR